MSEGGHGGEGQPLWLMSFADLIINLLTFFILMTCLSATQEGGLLGVGHGSLVDHIMAKGKPGIMKGHLRQTRMNYRRDAWWIPSQEGDADELERVSEKLDRELATRFMPHEASIHYEQDRVRMSVSASPEQGARGGERLEKRLVEVLDTVAGMLRGHPERRVRVSAHVPFQRPSPDDLLESARLGRLALDALVWHGAAPSQVSLWAWGSARPLLWHDPANAWNRGLEIEILDPTVDAPQDSKPSVPQEGAPHG